MVPASSTCRRHTGESRIDRRQSTLQMLRDEFWLKDNGAASMLGYGTVWTYPFGQRLDTTHVLIRARPAAGNPQAS